MTKKKHHGSSFESYLDEDGILEETRLAANAKAEEAAKLEALRVAVQVGIDELDRGEYTVFDDAKSLNAHLAKLAAKVIAGKKAR